MPEPRTTFGQFDDDLTVGAAGEGAAPAEWDWSWGTPVPEVDAQTFQDIWNSREFATKESTQGSLAAPGGGTVREGGALKGGTFGGLSDEQAANVRAIIRVGQERGLSKFAQTIAVMTALGESSLRNLNYGDDIHGVKNPDGSATSSIGMFQEQKWFGSVQTRMDPVASSGRFYDRLLAVQGWQDMKPTMAAHMAQRNADPNHYTKFWKQAANLVSMAYGG